jgi:sugar lactone lactonase YvrE
VIREVSIAGIVTTIAGTGEQGFAGDGGAATSALLDSPAGVAVDAAGNVYIADTHNNRVRKVSAGTISTIAGTGIASFSGDGGPAGVATLNHPTALAPDGSGNLYLADTDNHRIRKITGTTITTVAGDGEQFFSGDGAAATAAGLDSPNGVAVDVAGNIYIGDTHNQRVRVVNASGIISTLAGNASKSFAGDGDSQERVVGSSQGLERR